VTLGTSYSTRRTLADAKSKKEAVSGADCGPFGGSKFATPPPASSSIPKAGRHRHDPIDAWTGERAGAALAAFCGMEAVCQKYAPAEQ
jgi:hypothetical protein